MLKEPSKSNDPAGRVLATEGDCLSSVLRTHSDRENQLQEAVP